jgi:hypothetical protein
VRLATIVEAYLASAGDEVRYVVTSPARGSRRGLAQSTWALAASRTRVIVAGRRRDLATAIKAANERS